MSNPSPCQHWSCNSWNKSGWYKQKLNDDDEPELEQKSAAGRQTVEVKSEENDELPDMTSTCRNTVLRVSEVTCAGESPDESERQDQLHHGEGICRLQETLYTVNLCFKKGSDWMHLNIKGISSISKSQTHHPSCCTAVINPNPVQKNKTAGTQV